MEKVKCSCMSKDDLRKIVEAFKNGEQIEITARGANHWKPMKFPLWDVTRFDYRVTGTSTVSAHIDNASLIVEKQEEKKEPAVNIENKPIEQPTEKPVRAKKTEKKKRTVKKTSTSTKKTFATNNKSTSTKKKSSKKLTEGNGNENKRT